MIRIAIRIDILTTLYGGNAILVGLYDIVVAAATDIVVLPIKESLEITLFVGGDVVVKFVRLRNIFNLLVVVVVVDVVFVFIFRDFQPVQYVRCEVTYAKSVKISSLMCKILLQKFL